jgi:PAS domain S-box-containing protein
VTGRERVPADLSLLLLELESWHHLSLGPDFRLRGGAADGRILACERGGDVRGCLDAPGQRNLESLAASLAELPQAGGVALDTGGRPLELLLAPGEGDGYLLYYRSLESRLESLERLMLHFRFFQKSPQPIFLTDPEGIFLDANRAFLDLYGYTPDQLQGQTPRLLKSFRQVPSVYHHIWRTIKDPDLGFWTGEVINRKKSGEEVVVLAAITAVRRPDGRLLGFVATHQDITARKLLEQELRAKNRDLERLNELKSEFVAVTSHDLKSPLTAVVNYAEMLRAGGGSLPPAQSEAYLERIIQGAHSMARFINGILDLRQIETGTFVLNPVRVHPEILLRSLAERLAVVASAKEIRLEVTAPAGHLPPVIADPARLEQVFANLVGNAVKFSPAGSVVRTVLEPADGDGVRVTVRDQGPGIPAGELSSIFRPFYQVRETHTHAQRARGHGLGLSIAHQIVEQHGGRSPAAHGAGGGAVFTVEIPRGKPRRGEEAAAAIFDHRQELYASLVEPLRRRGLTCFLATSTRELSRILCYEYPEFIFADLLHSPGDLFPLCRDYRRGAPGAVLTGVAGEEPVPAEAAVFPRILASPVSDLELYEVLDALLEKGGPS